MSSERRTRRSGDSVPAREVLSDAHVGRPCLECFLCKDVQLVYSHPIKWKNPSLLPFLRSLEPTLQLQGDTCICRNCRSDLCNGLKDPNNFHPRWKRQVRSSSQLCEVPQCNEPACINTKLGSQESINEILKFSPQDPTQTSLCNRHYRTLHRDLKPENYQLKCGVCNTAIRGTSYRTCIEHDKFQRHLEEHTGFSRTLTANQKLCLGCYRHNLSVVRDVTEDAITANRDSEFESLITKIKNSLPMMPFTISEESKLIDIALTFTVIGVAEDLKEDRATSLPCAYSRFSDNIDLLLPMCSFSSCPKLGTPRWLLAQLSTRLKPHISYTCIIKKHGVIIYRQGRELQCLSHALFSARASRKQAKPKSVLKGINRKIRKLVETTIASPSCNYFNLDGMVEAIKKFDQDIWDAMCILTHGVTEEESSDTEHVTLVKKTRRLFILSQIMFLMDKRCSEPFHILTADMIDCFGGSSQLLRIFNRLGICAGEDTLKRHIQSTIIQLQEKGILMGLDPSGVIMFTMDNIDFLCSHAQVFCGKQNLSWHGTTLQAVYTKPSLDKVHVSNPLSNRRRTHALLSPTNSPHKQDYTSAPKRPRGRDRTGTRSNATPDSLPQYDFQAPDVPAIPSADNMTVADFSQSASEEEAIKQFLTQAFTYFLIKNGLPNTTRETFLSFQEFLSISLSLPTPEVGQVKYIQVLDEISDSKDTILHVISDLYARYMAENGHKFVVLVADAKVYEVIQSLKFEYKPDLNWLVVFPGDWHFLKNFQICLMKPFLEAGLKDLANVTSYPTTSIQNCSVFERANQFLLETWESIFRHMLQDFVSQHRDTLDSVTHTVQALNEYKHDQVAARCVIRSLQEEMAESGIQKSFRDYVEKMSAVDDTWSFWGKFLFEDCLAYIGLFMAIRSENWELRMASIKLMAPDFTAWDHPCYQKLIMQHIEDIYCMPEELLSYLKEGSFALSITGKATHSVALDEAHEMLINKHVKLTIVRPSKDYIERVARYIPARVDAIERFKSQIFHPKPNPKEAQICNLSEPPIRKKIGGKHPAPTQEDQGCQAAATRHHQQPRPGEPLQETRS